MERRKQNQLVKGLDRMLKSGRVTESEAAELRAASDPATFEELLQNLRVRHATEKMNAAVVGGYMTQEEANTNVKRLQNGEHPRSLRAHLAKILPREH